MFLAFDAVMLVASLQLWKTYCVRIDIQMAFDVPKESFIDLLFVKIFIHVSSITKAHNDKRKIYLF